MEENSVQRKITVKQGAKLVIGGDMVDRGPGDLRVLADVVTLKENFPDQVEFILGNRDINKLRLVYELIRPIDSTVESTTVYWAQSEEYQFKFSGNLNEFKVSKLKWVRHLLSFS